MPASMIVHPSSLIRATGTRHGPTSGRRPLRACLLIGVCLLSAGRTVVGQTEPQRQPSATPEERAIAFLSKEVPRWSVENKCFSCHNNGDAARALFAARKLAYDVDSKSLADTSAWLSEPGRWEHNGGEGEFSDKKLADIQFSLALAAAIETGVIENKAPLLRAAEKLAANQHRDGSWWIKGDDAIGSPVTYGRILATIAARQVLRQTGEGRFSKAVARSEKWLGSQRPKTVLDAASLLTAREFKLVPEQRNHCLAVIRRGEAEPGGWGPFVTSAPEPFDTAVVLLGLSRLNSDSQSGKMIERMIHRGRAFLVNSQRTDGSWPETTRPPNAESYAQRLSTTGWATLALLATRAEKP